MRQGAIIGWSACASLALGLLLSTSCASSAASPESSKAAPEELSGSELWGDTCGNCHFNRAPTWYTDAEWDVAVFHMGVTAHLTRAEREAVLRYLQAGN